MIEEWKTEKNWLIYVQIYSCQNMEEIFITYAAHTVIADIYNYSLPLPMPYSLCL